MATQHHVESLVRQPRNRFEMAKGDDLHRDWQLCDMELLPDAL